jgi:hypothetical protein
MISNYKIAFVHKMEKVISKQTHISKKVVDHSLQTADMVQEQMHLKDYSQIMTPSMTLTRPIAIPAISFRPLALLPGVDVGVELALVAEFTTEFAAALVCVLVGVASILVPPAPVVMA